MNTCPFCSSKMLRHISSQGIYWYCTSCHQEVPNLQNVIERAKRNSPRSPGLARKR